MGTKINNKITDDLKNEIDILFIKIIDKKRLLYITSTSFLMT